MATCCSRAQRPYAAIFRSLDDIMSLAETGTTKQNSSDAIHFSFAYLICLLANDLTVAWNKVSDDTKHGHHRLENQEQKVIVITFFPAIKWPSDEQLPVPAFPRATRKILMANW